MTAPFFHKTNAFYKSDRHSHRWVYILFLFCLVQLSSCEIHRHTKSVTNGFYAFLRPASPVSQPIRMGMTNHRFPLFSTAPPNNHKISKADPSPTEFSYKHLAVFREHPHPDMLHIRHELHHGCENSISVRRPGDIGATN